MPSHDIHRFLAKKYLGIPKYVTARVDKLIDLGPLHDIGRRKPRELPAYLDIVELGNIKKIYKIKLEKDIRNLLKEIFRSDVKSKTFYFHHALDILANRLASAIILNLRPENICDNLVKGTLCDLNIVEDNLVRMNVPCFGYLRKFNEELRNAIYLSCIDQTLVKWVRENIVLRYRCYRSLDYIKEMYSSTIINILKSDAKYEVGLSLGTMAYTNKISKMRYPIRVKSVYIISSKEVTVPSNELVDKESIEGEYRKVLQGKLESLSISPYGLGRLRRTIIVLATLYSGIYHLPFIEPVPLEIAFRELLSVSKKRYTMASKVLKCYSTCTEPCSETRKCALREIDLALKPYVNIIDKHRLGIMKNKFIEALEELLKFSNNLRINVLSDL